MSFVKVLFCCLFKETGNSLRISCAMFFPFQEAKKIAFMVFVGVCIVFQAITSDVYVYNKKKAILSPTVMVPTPTTVINASTLTMATITQSP